MPMSAGRVMSDDAREAGASLPSGKLTAQNYAFLQAYILRESGIVIDEDKRYLVESRLLPILRKEKILSLDLLCERLESGASIALSQQVIEAMTTNETLFFRDGAVFEALRTQVLPAIFDSLRGKRKARIWSAAASTGQEAYSLAMLVREAGKGSDEVEIIGTDLSEQVLERARQGKYVQFEVDRGLPASLLLNYFTRIGLEWQLKDEIRRMVRFEQLDLRRNLDIMTPCDLVLCRNVLIYFNAETKKRILAAIRSVLAPGGTLVLGCAETVINIDDGFQRKMIGQSTFYTV
jgi:chemotaxis protein methyltransferase CheR